MRNDPTTVWGKNPELEHFWGELASRKKVVIIYTNNTHKYVNLPNLKTQKYKLMFTMFNEDPNIIVLC